METGDTSGGYSDCYDYERFKVTSPGSTQALRCQDWCVTRRHIDCDCLQKKLLDQICN